MMPAALPTIVTADDLCTQTAANPNYGSSPTPPRTRSPPPWLPLPRAPQRRSCDESPSVARPSCPPRDRARHPPALGRSASSASGAPGSSATHAIPRKSAALTSDPSPDLRRTSTTGETTLRTRACYHRAPASLVAPVVIPSIDTHAASALFPCPPDLGPFEHCPTRSRGARRLAERSQVSNAALPRTSGSRPLILLPPKPPPREPMKVAASIVRSPLDLTRLLSPWHLRMGGAAFTSGSSSFLPGGAAASEQGCESDRAHVRAASARVLGGSLCAPLITSARPQAQLIGESGIDLCVVEPFRSRARALGALGVSPSACWPMRSAPSHVWRRYDFTFGKDRGATPPRSPPSRPPASASRDRAGQQSTNRLFVDQVRYFVLEGARSRAHSPCSCATSRSEGEVGSRRGSRRTIGCPPPTFASHGAASSRRRLRGMGRADRRLAL